MQRAFQPRHAQTKDEDSLKGHYLDDLEGYGIFGKRLE